MCETRWYHSPTDEYVEFNYLVPTEVQHTAKEAPHRARALLREHSIVDFVGRTENLNDHLAQALLAAGMRRCTDLRTKPTAERKASAARTGVCDPSAQSLRLMSALPMPIHYHSCD